jgi:hypothetical protein
VRAPSLGKRAAAFVTATLSAQLATSSGDTAYGATVGGGGAGADSGGAGADESSTVRQDDRPLRVAGRLVTP